MRKSILWLIILLSTFASGLCGEAAKAPLQLGVLPFEAADKIRENFRPFSEYLSRQVGREVRIYVSTDYAALTEALRAKKIDLVLLSPFPYVLASNQMKLVPLFLWLEMKEKGKRGSGSYRGVIIARKDSGIRTIHDLKGKKMVFMDPASTSGHLYPVELMMRHGIDPRRDLKNRYYAGNAEAVVNSVYNGHADAGALYKGGMERMLKDVAKIEQMEIVAETRDIPNGVFAVRSDLPKSLIAKIRKAIVDLDKSGECEKICGPFMVNGWIPAKDEMFDDVRKVARILKLELKKK